MIASLFKYLAVAVLWALTVSPALAATTINPNQPADGAPYSPSVIRQNFQAAANDIAALQVMNAGPSPPANPTLGMMWLEAPQNGTVYTLQVWSGPGQAWLPLGALDVVNNIWMPPVAGGVLPALLSGSLVDLGSVPQATVTVTGAQSVFSFGSAAPTGTIKYVLFSGNATLVFNSSTMILPGMHDITTAPGDVAIALALGGGNWQVIFYQPAAAQIGVTQGGTGRNFLTPYSVLLGQGPSPVNFAVPGAAGAPLVSQGPAANPVFAPLDLSSGGVTGVCPVARGCTGNASVPAHAVPVGEGSAPMSWVVPGSAGQIFGSAGPGLDPIFGVNVGLEYLPVVDPAHGGTAQASLTPHSLIVGEGTAPVSFVVPGAAGLPVLSTGAGSDPVFGPLDLTGPGITGVIPWANLPPPDLSHLPVVDVPHGGTGHISFLSHAVLLGENVNPFGTAAPSTAGYPLLSQGPTSDPVFGPINVGLSATVLPASGPITILASRAKCTGIGAGGGGGAGSSVGNNTYGGGGQAGGWFVAWLSGLAVGQTLSGTVGTGGSAGIADGGGGGNGSDTMLQSGTQIITTRTAFGGAGGQGGSATPGVGGSASGVSTGVGGDLLGQGGGGGNGASGGAQVATMSIMHPFGSGSVAGGPHINGVAGHNGVLFCEWVVQ